MAMAPHPQPGHSQQDRIGALGRAAAGGGRGRGCSVAASSRPRRRPAVTRTTASTKHPKPGGSPHCVRPTTHQDPLPQRRAAGQPAGAFLARPRAAHQPRE
jgi:hypothetical protein